MTPEQAQDLVAVIRQHAAPLVPDVLALQRLTGAVQVRTLDKGQHLARAGEVADALFFVRSGIVRYYYLAEGLEHTGQFFSTGMLVADVASLTGGVSSQQNIDALAGSTILVIPRAALLRAYDEDHALERFGRRVVEQAMAGAQRRSAALLMTSPEQRYRQFVAARPEVANAVAQYVIASYLGITPESLSRIRARR
ncbi:Crp/Fnr family transcriptional regulator [uncultured Devosia sp.]|uniref:Crp/Fnr family transcriptional regulator n=1 Tax=uncultured Devosia sp. TaxID=211434 RepID=UPI0035CAF48F